MENLRHEEPNPEAARLVTQLGSKKAEERAAAEEALEQMGPEGVESLLALVAQEARKRKKRTRIYYGIWIGYGGVLALGLLIYTLHGAITGQWGKFPFELFRVFTFTGMLTGLLAASQTHKNAAAALAQFDDKRAVGPLAEALEFGDNDKKAVAEAALVKLLPGLQASDSPLLNEDQRKCLYNALKSKNTELILAILKAFAQVGGSKELPHVEKLLESGTFHPESQIIEAAKACLPLLQERAERERQSQTLLRAASAPDDPSQVLLRPAHGVSETDPNLLLRPSAPEE